MYNLSATVVSSSCLLNYTRNIPKPIPAATSVPMTPIFTVNPGAPLSGPLAAGELERVALAVAEIVEQPVVEVVGFFGAV